MRIILFIGKKHIRKAILYYYHSIIILSLHRDIKGGNVLVDDNGLVKLADFGASQKFDLSGTQATTSVKG